MKIRLLIPIWGERYIARFAAYSLPSLLAAGNLPALAKFADLEVWVLTSSHDQPLFDDSVSIAGLRRLCPVKFIPIDDLIGSTYYGITLTLAYVRGMSAAGPEMTDTYFVFMNSDFLLADGSLQSLTTHIAAGRNCVLAPSFRSTAEDVEPLIFRQMDPATKTLPIMPRDMARIALRYPHPTIIAKTVNQGTYRSLFHNQLYWQVDENTMLGRFFLLFMLCIKPERVMSTANTYCDYGFVPELCPSGNISVLSDSDDFFMLEAQSRTHECSHVRFGVHEQESIDKYLAATTTRGHRWGAGVDILIHCEDLPAGLKAVRQEAQEYVAKLENRLPPPQAHANHSYWVGAVPLWQDQMRALGKPEFPPELARDTQSAAASVTPATGVTATLRYRVFHQAARMLIGKRPDVKMWHRDWTDYRLARNEIKELADRSEGRILLVCNSADPLSALLSDIDPSRIVRLDTLRLGDDVAASASTEQFGSIIYVLRPSDMDAEGRRLSPGILSRLGKKGEVLVIVHDRGTAFQLAPVIDYLVSYLTWLSATGPVDATAKFCGGAIKGWIRNGTASVLRLFVRWWGFPLAVLSLPAVPLLFAFGFLHNLYTVRFSRFDRQYQHCSTAIFRIRKR